MESTKKIELPSLIPVLPVRNTVLFPNAAVPLVVGRTKSIRAIREAQKSNDLILVVTQKDAQQDDPTHGDLYKVGVVCVLSKVAQGENDSLQLIANGVVRFRIQEYVSADGFLGARGYQMVDRLNAHSPAAESLAAELKKVGKAILQLASLPGGDAVAKLFSQIQDPEHIADLCCTFVNLPVSVKQNLLEMENAETRLSELTKHMNQEREKLQLQNEVQSKMMERLAKDQRDHLLREQLKTIHEELGEEGTSQDDLGRKVEEAGMPPEAEKIAKEELGRLAMIQRASPEYHVIRTYLEWLVSLPWKKTSATEVAEVSLDKARQILEEDHYGIEKVKKRIVQFLAVTKLKKDLKGPILCLVGPPGVGKTSIGKSIARSLGRSFHRTSLGGVRDEAEIRGHRRTYIGAMPGRIIQTIKRAGVKDPLIMLDEIDKLGMDFRGDPASALLEVLDPEQNSTFVDHYIDTAFDLSQVFFICTANVVETIPPALRDRMEIIEMSSYSKREKQEIASRHLVPKILADHGIKEEQIDLPKETLEALIESYTREAGVRELSRKIAHLARAAAEQLAQPEPAAKVALTPDTLDGILGPQKYYSETVEGRPHAGVVTGLAWTPVGGEILNIELTKMEGKGSLILTGQLGDVMKESAQIALSLIRSRWGRHLPFVFDKTDIHVHVPAGAIPKDGPSAGVALFLAMASLTQNKAVRPKFALTGEVTLRGTVLPVGGIKEKVIAAHRAGIETVVLPERNKGDLVDITPDVKDQLKFHFIKEVDELLPLAGLDPRPSPIMPSSTEISGSVNPN